MVFIRQGTVSNDIWSLHLLPAQVSEARLGSGSGPHACLLHPLLPKGKVRAVVFMGLGTRQSLGFRGDPDGSGSEASWFSVPKLWAGGRCGQGRGPTLMIFPSFLNHCLSTYCIPDSRGHSSKKVFCLVEEAGDQ